MTRLKLLAISFLMLIGLGAHAQTMAVESFELAPTDLTANTHGTMEYDQNGNLCALIKLETTQKGFTFNVGVLGVAKTEEHVGEIWIYVPFGVKKITVQHPQLGTLRDYPIPCSIDKGRTYIMKLTAGNVRTIVEHAQTKQFLMVKLSPADAFLEINGKMKMTEGGVYRELLPFGTYDYKAYCKDYHDLSGQVVVSDPENTHSLNIRLKAAFGHLSVKSNSTNSGANLYIDNTFVGKIPVTDIKLSSGTHTMRVMREMYEPYNTTFTIADEEKKSMSPSLLADFAEVTLTTSEGADIYINDELKGTRTWKGRLATGSYIFESRQKGHLSSRLSYDITRNDQGKTLDVPAPTPIYGSLVLDSNPTQANIYIDGKYIGQTPKYIARQIVGEYKVEAKLDGYKPQTKTVTVSEGEEASLSFTLEKGVVAESFTVRGSALGKPANCYIVSKSGAYSFPTVKGNSRVSVGPVASAVVLWESFGTSVTPSVGDLIKSVSYANGTITFRTADTFKEGNAVIAAKDASGTILWSWHIWLTDQPQSQVYNKNAGTMMDRNLGATSAEPGDVGALGLLYQWGRKDPFLGASSISSSTVAKSTITWPSPVSTGSSYGTVSYVLAHPTTYVTSSSSNDYDWYYPSRNNTLWTTSDKTKSIYDPCPAGWRVPDGGSGGVWKKAGFDDTTYDSKNEGMSFSISSPSKTWYPASGCRNGNVGDIFRVGFGGSYWSASPSSDNAYSLNFHYNDYVYPSGYDYRLYGFSVRCVRECKEDAKLDDYRPQTQAVMVAEGAEAASALALDTGVASESRSVGSSASGQPANCYIISKSGTYSFPTVKGNSTVSVGSVASAQVLWESFGTSVTPSVGDLIKSVSYANGSITFRTADTFKEGNAVIAAKDASGTILWSWHIWLTDQPQAQVYYNNAGTMMDRNLGATSATPGHVGALGLLYQWGRKDPFLGASSITSTVEAKSTIIWPSAVLTSSSTGTESYVLAHPTTYVIGSASNDYDWHYSSRNNELWSTTDKTKSIYDPCPAGWRVPDGGDSGVWSKTNGSSLSFSNSYINTTAGMNFSGRFGSAGTIWYPASGHRDFSDGCLSSVGNYGDYWSASPSNYRAYGLGFNEKGYVNPSGGHKRAHSFSVRCLQE